MPRSFVFGSSTPRDLSHQLVRKNSSVLNALGQDAPHDVRPFVRSIHSARSESCPRRLSRQYVFGSSTPRDWSHQQQIPFQHRVYDAKPPPKIRSQTIDSFRHIGGSIKSVASVGGRGPGKVVSSRESRPRLPRPNLPPAPSTSRPAKKRQEEEEDALSEPDFKPADLPQFFGEPVELNSNSKRTRERVEPPQPQMQTAKQLIKPVDDHANLLARSQKANVVNNVIETESELIFERSEDLTPDAQASANQVEEMREMNAAVARKQSTMMAKSTHDDSAKNGGTNGDIGSRKTVEKSAEPNNNDVSINPGGVN